MIVRLIVCDCDYVCVCVCSGGCERVCVVYGGTNLSGKCQIESDLSWFSTHLRSEVRGRVERMSVERWWSGGYVFRLCGKECDAGRGGFIHQRILSGSTQSKLSHSYTPNPSKKQPHTVFAARGLGRRSFKPPHPWEKIFFFFFFFFALTKSERVHTALPTHTLALHCVGGY